MVSDVASKPLDSSSDTVYQEYSGFQAGQRRTYQEMRQKPAPRDTFFSLRNEPQSQRPTSVATEFVDTDFDDEDILTDEENSPRISLQSVSLAIASQTKFRSDC